MAITTKPDAAPAQAYTVTRAIYWGGQVQPVGTVLQLTKPEAVDLLNANKVTPGAAPEADKPTKPAKPVASSAQVVAAAPTAAKKAD